MRTETEHPAHQKFGPRLHGQHAQRQNALKKIRETKQVFTRGTDTNTLKVAVLGGCEEIGRNMTVLEYGNDIVIIDMGLQFPEEDMPGIDYIIPNVSSLLEKKDRIRGVIVTHGHFDHIGAISHLIPELGYPTIYTAPLTAGLIRRRHQDFKDQPELRIQIVDPSTQLLLGKSFRVSFFAVTHTIPDSMWVLLDTPVGRIVHTGDFKFDPEPIIGNPVDKESVRRIAHEKKIRLFLVDSTNASKPGHQLSEGDVAREIDGIFGTINGRIIIGTFASNIIRIQSIISIAEQHGRRVMLEGRSLHNAVEVAHELGLLKFQKGTLVEGSEGLKMSPERLVIVCTGAQGEKNAVLMRIANNEHKYLAIKKGDTVLFSSSVIPGNERTIQSLRDGLTRAGAKVINYEMMDIHAGGHMKADDLRELIHLVQPEYYMPIHANHYMLRDHAEIAYQEGYDEKHVFVADNGQVVEVTMDEARLTEERLPSDYVFVDGLGVGDVSEIVLRDRRVMAADGMLVIIVTVEKKTGKLVQNPDLISRGFIYMKENKDLVEQTRLRVKKLLKDKDSQSPAFEQYLKTKIRNDIGQFLFTKTKRRPLILPVLIEV
jgi:ribonuclease J